MKKLLISILIIALVTSTMFVSAAGEKALKLTFSSVPDEEGGWLNVKGITGAVQAKQTVAVHVYNSGDDEISCFLSGREAEKWDTVSVSDTFYIAPGESMLIEMYDLSEKAAYYLLELRELTESSVIYVWADATTSYSDKLAPMSDLIEGKYCTVSVGTVPAEGTVDVVQTPAATPTPTAEITPTATATSSPAVTATAAVTPGQTESAAGTAAPTPDTGTDNGPVTTLAAVIAILTVIIIAGGIIGFVVIKRKNKK